MFALWFPFSPFFLGISLDIASWSVFAFLFIHFETDEDCVFLWCSVILFIVPFTWFLMTIRLLHSFFCLFYIWGSHQRYMFVLSHRKIPIHRLRDVYSREPRLEQQSSRVDSPCVMISIQNMYVCVYIYILYYIISYYIILYTYVYQVEFQQQLGMWSGVFDALARKLEPGNGQNYEKENGDAQFLKNCR